MWKSDWIPRYGLMLKYLQRIMTEDELRDLLKKYVAAKKAELENRGTKRKPKP